MNTENDIEDRKVILLKLIKEFLGPESAYEARRCLSQGNFAIAECHILINLDDLFENKMISGREARQAYVALNLNPDTAVGIRQVYEFETYSFYAYNMPINHLN
jgi:hypothetical protein